MASSATGVERADGSVHPRTEMLKRIDQVGLAQWKKDLAEMVMFRLNTLFGNG